MWKLGLPPFAYIPFFCALLEQDDQGSDHEFLIVLHILFVHSFCMVMLGGFACRLDFASVAN